MSMTTPQRRQRPCKHYRLDVVTNGDAEVSMATDRIATCTLLDQLGEAARLETCAAMGMSGASTKCPYESSVQHICLYYAPKSLERTERRT
jgi:hypothetical protein